MMEVSRRMSSVMGSCSDMGCRLCVYGIANHHQGTGRRYQDCISWHGHKVQHVGI